VEGAMLHRTAEEVSQPWPDAPDPDVVVFVKVIVVPTHTVSLGLTRKPTVGFNEMYIGTTEPLVTPQGLETIKLHKKASG